MPQPVATLGMMHVCPKVEPGPVPHVGGPIIQPGQPIVSIMGMKVAVVGAMCVCVGPPDTVTQGSSIVKIMGKPIVRMGDGTAHGGKVVMGMPIVKAD
jgi:uncharacterized Zn-binding protein involved in type VI secretion